MSIHRIRRKKGYSYKAVVSAKPRPVSRCFDRKIDAEAWERQQRTQSDQGGTMATGRSAMTVGALAEKWLAEHSLVRKAPASYRRDGGLLKVQILPRFRDVKINKVTAAEVETWMRDLTSGRDRKPICAKTCNNALIVLKTMMTDAVRWRLLSQSPVQGVRPFKLPPAEYQFWSSDEIRQFMCHVAGEKSGMVPTFALALYTGMRRGEIRALKWDAVDLERSMITVRASWCDIAKGEKPPKSGKIRQVPINSSLRSVLVEAKVRSRSDRVVSDVQMPLNATRVMPRLCRAAEVSDLRFHDLRHTFASQFMMNGGNIYDLQKLLGHSTIQVTERYSHLHPGHLQGTTEILNFSGTPQAEVIRIRG